MSTAFILIGLLLVTLLLLWRAAPISRTFDHYYHDTIIDFIRLNRHRFLRERPDFLYDSKMVYPQLYHWLFSFVPASRKEPAIWFSSIAFPVGSYVLFLWFLDQIFPALAETYSLNRDRFYAWAASLFVLSPYLYDTRDPRIGGFSTRGFALLLCQGYLYATHVYIVSGSLLFFVLATILAVLIVPSSQLSLQYLVLSAPLLSLLYADMRPVLAPLLAVGLLFLVAPFATRQYLVGQILHKRHYAKHLAGIWFLRRRYSIWRDFVWDFWILAGGVLRPIADIPRARRWKHITKMYGRIRKGWRNFVRYVYGNSFVRTLTGYPALLAFIAASAGTLLVREPMAAAGHPLRLLSVPIFVGLSLVVLTSFRLTRFLGKPERYAEYASGHLAIVVSILLSSRPALLAAILAASSLFIVWEFNLRKEPVSQKSTAGKEARLLRRELENIERQQPGELRVLSNRRVTMKGVMSTSRKVFYGSRNLDMCGNLHILDVYKDGNTIKAEAIPTIIKEFDINTFLLHRKGDGNCEAIFEDPDLKWQFRFSAGDVQMFTVQDKSRGSLGS